MNIMTTLFCALFIKMTLPDESLVKDVWSAMWEVQTHARREKVPGPCRNFGKLANSCFEQWLTKPDVLRLYAEKVLADPFDPRETTRQLQHLHSCYATDTARACIRLISLLEKVSSK